MYSQNSGLHFIFAVTVIKFLIGVSARAGIQWEWNSPVPENYLYLARVAVILFFKASEEKQVRCALIFSLDTINVLVSMADAGKICHSNVCYIVQITTIGNTKTQKIQNLMNCCFLNKQQILSIPYHEMLSLVKATQNAINLFKHLNKEGIFVDIKNLILLTDSASTLTMCTAQPNQLESKFGHLASRITLMLMQLDGSPQENIYFFGQLNNKNNKKSTIKKGEIFAADLLTKCDTDLTPDELCDSFPKAWGKAEQWLSQPPDTWGHVTKQPPGMFKDGEVVIGFQLTKKSTRDFIKKMGNERSSSGTSQLTLQGEGVDQSVGVNCLATGIESDRGDGSLAEGRFDKLLKRKFSKNNSTKSAFHILSLVKWYVVKLKLMTKLNSKERNIKKKEMQNNLRVIKQCDPFKPSCSLTCGLYEQKGPCGGLHHVVKDIFFSNKTSFRYNWPLICSTKETPVKDIFRSILVQIGDLQLEWSEKHECTLIQYILCVLSSQQIQKDVFKNLQVMNIEAGVNQIQIGVGRSQSTLVGARQINLGRPVFRLLHRGSIFTLSIIFWHHLKGEHKRALAKASMLRHGFVTSNMELDLKAIETRCGQCMKHKAMSTNTKDELYASVNGNYFNLGQICNNPYQHTVVCDYFGHFYGKDNTKLWGLVYLSHNTGMVQIHLMETLSIQGFLESFEVLVSTTGAVCCLLSDQGSQLCTVANVYEMNGDDAPFKDETHPSRRMQNPLARLLQNGGYKGETGGISYRVLAAGTGNMNGQIEKVIGITKKALSSGDFFEKSKNYTLSKIRAIFAAASSTLNTRAIIKLTDGRLLSPFDVVSLTQMTGMEPFQNLKVHSDDRKIQAQIKDFENMKSNIQLEIFNKYCEHLFLDSGWRQRGNFAFQSKHLEIGDLILLKDEFQKTKSFSKSIRRVSHLDQHRRHCVCYHLVSPQGQFDNVQFEKEYKGCKTTAQKQQVVRQYFGNYSFQSVDLRKTTLVAKAKEGPKIDLFFKRSKDQVQRHPLVDANALQLQKMYDKMTNTSFAAGADMGTACDEAISIKTKDYLKDEEKARGEGFIEEKRNEIVTGNLPNELQQGKMTKTGRKIIRPVYYGFEN